MLENVSGNPSYTNELRTKLREYGISLGALARKAKIDRSQLSRWFNTPMEPGWKSIVRLESAVNEILLERRHELLRSGEGVAPVAPGQSNALGFRSLSREDAGELDRLREYVNEYKRLIDLHDRTPARWKYFQTEWLWLYLRGMISGETPQAVKQRRLKELENAKQGHNSEEVKALQNEDQQSDPVVEYVKIELFGGPADGRAIFVSPPLPNYLEAYALNINGRTLKPLYKKLNDRPEDIVAFRLPRPSATIDHEALIEAFAHRKSTRYVFVPPRRRKS